ncbi:MAG: HAD family hydrolase [Polyangiaceae bacterium]
MTAGAPVRGLLVDIDDTLYDYVAAEKIARAAVLEAVATSLAISQADASNHWDTARRAVKARLGERASAHSRLLYLADLIHVAARPDALPLVRGWESLFWDALLGAATLRRGALELVSSFRANGGRVAVVTDLTLEIQLRKLERFGLLSHVDVVVASEEVPWDKPAPELFRLALERLSLDASECLMVGDSAKKDGGGATALGLRYFQIRSTENQSGGTFETLAEELRPR